MVLTRASMPRRSRCSGTGRLGTFASSLGQEAVVVGLASAMRAEDVLLPSYRETGAQLFRGVSLEELLCTGAATSAAAISPGRGATSR